MKHPDGTPLRNGFTTGAAATAAAVGAWTAQNGAPPPEQVELLLPDGSFLAIPLERCAPGTATVRKDGGDDPDVTDRAPSLNNAAQGGFTSPAAKESASSPARALPFRRDISRSIPDRAACW